MVWFISPVICLIAFACLSAQAAAPRVGKLDAYIRETAKKTGKAETEVRNNATLVLVKESRFTRADLRRVLEGEQLDPLREKLAMSYLRGSRSFFKEMRVDELRELGLKASQDPRYSEQILDVVANDPNPYIRDYAMTQLLRALGGPSPRTQLEMLRAYFIEKDYHARAGFADVIYAIRRPIALVREFKDYHARGYYASKRPMRSIRSIALATRYGFIIRLSKRLQLVLLKEALNEKVPDFQREAERILNGITNPIDHVAKYRESREGLLSKSESVVAESRQTLSELKSTIDALDLTLD